MLQAVEGKAPCRHCLGLDGFIGPQGKHFFGHHPVEILFQGQGIHHIQVLFPAVQEHRQGAPVFFLVHQHRVPGISGHQGHLAAFQFFLVRIQGPVLHTDKMAARIQHRGLSPAVHHFDLAGRTHLGRKLIHRQPHPELRTAPGR